MKIIDIRVMEWEIGGFGGLEGNGFAQTEAILYFCIELIRNRWIYLFDFIN